MRRTIALSFLVVSLLGGCSRPDRSGNETVAEGGPPVTGDWIIVRYEAEPDSLNPIVSNSAVASYVMYGVNNSQIYELLMGYNANDDWSLTEPKLVEAPPQISENHLTYTFTIRDGVKWHDGQLFTADDVLFTFKAAMFPLVDSAPKRSYFTDLKDI